MTNIAKSKFFLPLAGLLGGLANGLMGAGGGIIIVYAMNYALEEVEIDRKDIFANALCVMLPISAVSCITYAIRGDLVLNGIGIYSIPAIIGGIVGGILLGKIRSDALSKIFAALVIYSGLILVIR